MKKDTRVNLKINEIVGSEFRILAEAKDYTHSQLLKELMNQDISIERKIQFNKRLE